MTSIPDPTLDVAAATTPASVRLLVCVGPRCDAEGKGRALLQALRDALETAFANDLKTGRLSFAARDCLRLCTGDPVIRLEPSGDAFSEPEVDELLRLVAAALSAPERSRTADGNSAPFIAAGPRDPGL
jgi:NADH:ubiquinone oxidoreductase subunit E